MLYNQNNKVILSLVAVLSSVSLGAQYSPTQIADAIYLAEGGSSTKHPYGILKKFKTTTPRQACLNTINHAIKDYGKPVDDKFIDFLANRYAPVGVSNDPKGLNKNWAKNVKLLLKKAERKTNG